MPSLKKSLMLLKKSNFLEAKYSGNEKVITNASLLSHGQLFQQQLQSLLQNASADSVQYIKTSSSIYDNTKPGDLVSSEFYRHLKFIYRSVDLLASTIVFKTHRESNLKSLKSDFFHLEDNKLYTILESFYFTHASRSLETFYNVQRMRKIWWMRHSADPSRYTVESLGPDIKCDNEKIDPTFLRKCQSIKIKSNFTYNQLDMENITLFPLNELNQYAIETPSLALIRTTVNLDLVTYALLLDGIEHNKDTLLLHRQLTPFQCLLVQFVENDNVDFGSLSRHIQLVLSRTGLRVFRKALNATSIASLQSVVTYADNLGINYTILVNQESLQTGRLSLRNRDTTLSETIHISDLPTYLLNIFAH